MIDLSQFKKCPKCGESNVDTATRCSICGAAMAAAGPGFEREDALSAAAATQQQWQAGEARQPWQADGAPAAPPPPPPPPGGLSKPPTDGAALAKDEAEIAAARARAAAGNPLNVLKRNLLAPALAATVIAVMITVGQERKTVATAPAAGTAQADPAEEATAMFLDYTLQTGRDKGKTMRRFWAEYPLTFAGAARGRKVEDIGVSYVAQQSALGGLIFDIFVVIRAEGERGIVHPFRVDLETGEVAGATGCVFSLQNERAFAAEKCLPASDVFPGGI